MPPHQPIGDGQSCHLMDVAGFHCGLIYLQLQRHAQSFSNMVARQGVPTTAGAKRLTWLALHSASVMDSVSQFDGSL